MAPPILAAIVTVVLFKLVFSLLIRQRYFVKYGLNAVYR
ncbi:hypothetical protein B4102_1657 [Heyndrickxia sporothermodurans]|uniref:Uncharacterized protein n=1 Tax=Heyndrickxia sporothermodurans TaxID=46224 RepID=A0A150LEU4_9BACI|nr:hypothetical protein B4102_1657 [Heyndrickxia sporothermodurans]